MPEAPHYAPPGGPHVPAAQVLTLLREAFPGEQLGSVLEPHGLARRFRLVTSGRQHWLTLEVADRIVTQVLDDAGLWQLDPVLAAIYEADAA